MQMLTVHPELLGELAPPPVSLTVIDSLEVVLASKENTGKEVHLNKTQINNYKINVLLISLLKHECYRFKYGMT